jgi:hypothetical protein
MIPHRQFNSNSESGREDRGLGKAVSAFIGVVGDPGWEIAPSSGSGDRDSSVMSAGASRETYSRVRDLEGFKSQVRLLLSSSTNWSEW